jgi:hypothetical protein
MIIFNKGSIVIRYRSWMRYLPGRLLAIEPARIGDNTTDFVKIYKR